MKRPIILFLIIIFLTAGIILWWKQGLLPNNPKDKTPYIFVVKKGEGVRTIANRLKSNGLIKNPIVFFLLVKQLGLDKKLEAGDFRLNPSMTAEEVAQNLTHGTLDIWITIPEGQRAAEIADSLKGNIPSYKSSWKTSLTVNEGYLFPDTYLIPRDAEIDLVISLMKNNFNKKYESIKNLKSTNLTDNETVILASMVEREAKFPQDRFFVASVLVNRLSLSMPLQIDATVQYLLGYSDEEKTWWRKNITIDDLKINSNYNTYKNAGLPIAPISNPGIDALKAAINPEKTNYLYYISDKSGHLHFAKTLEGHNANVNKYINN